MNRSILVSKYFIIKVLIIFYFYYILYITEAPESPDPILPDPAPALPEPLPLATPVDEPESTSKYKYFIYE